MNAWLLAGGFSIGLLSLLFGLRIAFRAVFLAKSMGYRHMEGVVVHLYVWCCVFCFISAVLLPERLHQMRGAGWMVLAVAIICPLTGSLMVAASGILPQRKLRTAVSSKAGMPFAAFGSFMLVVVPPLLGVCYYQRLLTGNISLRLVTLSLTAGIALLGLDRRAGAATAQDALTSDPRPPVLYLRAFSREKDVFAKVGDDGQNYPDRPRGEQQYRNVEEFLRRGINERIGPFVALGSPLDYVPPDGAARLYAADQTWKRNFIEIASRAQLILLLPNNSRHLRYELSYIRRAGWTQKVRVLTRPQLKLTKWQHFMWRISAFIVGPTAKERIAEHDWPGFQAALVEAGFPPGKEDPPPSGSILALNRAGSLRLIQGEMITADDFTATLASDRPTFPEAAESMPVLDPESVEQNNLDAATRGFTPRSSLTAAVASFVFVSLLVSSFAFDVFTLTQQHKSKKALPATLRLINRATSERLVLTVSGGQTFLAGSRVTSRAGSGVFSKDITGSVPVSIDEGNTGTVENIAEYNLTLLLVKWDPQVWQEDTWQSTWGFPGLYKKKYVKLPAFEASINVDNLALTR